MNIALKNTKPALLVLDYQKVIIENFIPSEQAETALKNTRDLIQYARNSAIPIMFVKVAFQRGYPEINFTNAVFSEIKAAGLFGIQDSGSEIHDIVKPDDGDVVIVKHRIGAFTGTSLEMHLRAIGIDTLILAGLTTNGVVLSTTRQAIDLDYRVVIVEDCCADTSTDKHTLVINNVLSEHALITRSATLKAAFAG